MLLSFGGIGCDHVHMLTKGDPNNATFMRNHCAVDAFFKASREAACLISYSRLCGTSQWILRL